MLTNIILFIVLPTLALAVGFGIAWPLVEVARSKVERWRDAPGSRKFVWSGVILAIAGIGIAVAILDIVVNYTAATLVFWRLPEEGDAYLTKRIQHYLNRVSELKRPEYIFNRAQWLYIKFVVKVANRIDKTPHFRIPSNLVRYFS